MTLDDESLQRLKEANPVITLEELEETERQMVALREELEAYMAIRSKTFPPPDDDDFEPAC